MDRFMANKYYIIPPCTIPSKPVPHSRNDALSSKSWFNQKISLKKRNILKFAIDEVIGFNQVSEL
jgi:hypothetical protein